MTIKLDLSGVKIPKKVAGVKVPKQLRKGAKKLVAKAQTPAGQEAIAAGLTIAGAAIAASAKARSERAAAKHAAAAEPAPPPPPNRPGEPGTDATRGPAHQLNPGLEQAITAGIGALQNFLAGKRV